MSDELLTLPQVAVRAQIPLDRLRKIARSKLAPLKLIVKVGPQWICRANDLDALVKAFRSAIPAAPNVMAEGAR